MAGGGALVLVLLGLFGLVLSLPQQNITDNLADSSVTSYSSVVIHHPSPKNKKGLTNKGDEEGVSQSYFKVKRIKAITEDDTNGQETEKSASRSHDEKKTERQSRTEQKSTIEPKQREIKNHRTEEKDQIVKMFKSDSQTSKSEFRPSQYLPESEVPVSFEIEKDQSSQGARHTEYLSSKEFFDFDSRRQRHKDDNNREHKWRQPYRYKPGYSSSEEPHVMQKVKQDDSQFHREVFIHHDHKPQHQEIRPQHHLKPEDYKSIFSYDPPNYLANIKKEAANSLQNYRGSPEKRLRPIPPPGMSDELIETLLSQQPQTFDSEPKPEVISQSKKNPKGQTFKVGYSIGFGNGHSSDVVVGKPKDFQLHVNGRNSVWKKLPQGVEMSQSLDENKPVALKLEDNSFRHNDNVLKKDVYYMQNFKPDTSSIPTSGRASFNHAQALTHSNSFDFSNAMEEPAWLPKQPRALGPSDVEGIYHSLGYPPPVPVLFPAGRAQGEPTMVHALVIPIEQLQAAPIDYNWAAAALPHVPVVAVGGGGVHQQLQPVAQALTMAPSALAQLVPSHPQQQQQPISHYSHQQQQQPLPYNHKPQSSSNHKGHQPQLFHPSHEPALYHSHPQPSVVYQLQEKPRHKSRAPKLVLQRQVGAYSSSPIVVSSGGHQASPASSSISSNSRLQRELKNILAEEMKRKNHPRHPSTSAGETPFRPSQAF